jgi:hypothetical protein
MSTKKATKRTSKKSATTTKKTTSNGNPAKKPSGSVRNFIDPELKINKTVTGNPRREGTHGYDSFALIKNGMTVAQFLAKGGRLRDLHWDLSHNYVELKKA